MSSPDLTQRPPRSPRVRLGGYVMLPRLIDKGRATLAGKNGEFHYNCPLDQRFFEFVGLDAELFKQQLASKPGDGEILEWISENSANKPSLVEILNWSAYQVERVPTDTESRHFMNDYHEKLGPKREDIATWFDVLDLDDFVSFGGVA